MEFPIIPFLMRVLYYVEEGCTVASSSEVRLFLVCGVRGRTQRIVGGSVTLAHEYPWIVGLSRQGKLYCGGSLITKKHILTAAHCVNGMEAADIRVI